MSQSPPSPGQHLPPKVFISYAHEGEHVAEWAIKLKNDLVQRRVSAIVDQKDNPPGGAIGRFCVETPLEADWILCICTPEYVNRTRKGSDHRLVAEYEAILGEVHKKKVIPLLRLGETATSVPPGLKDLVRIDFRNDNTYSANLSNLVAHILGREEPGDGPHTRSETRIILVADVDGFSEMSGAEQEYIMSQVWPELQKIKVEVAAWDDEFPILDGVGLLWHQTDNYRHAVRAAELITERIRSRSGGPAFRCGVHLGTVGSKPINGTDYFHYFGTGINDAGRACGLGDAGQIILTNYFWFEAHRSDTRWKGIRNVEPGPGNLNGFEVFPHRGDNGKIRVYLKANEERRVPTRVQLRSDALQRFRELLGEIGILFVEELEQQFQLNLAKSKPRVTFWLPGDEDEGELWFSGHRMTIKQVSGRKEAASAGGRWIAEPCLHGSNTHYATATPGEGPPGMAWILKGEGAVVAHDLPVFGKNKEGYFQGLKEFHLSPDKVAGFSAKSRLIGCCAFPAPAINGLKPFGVICVDFENHSGEGATRQQLEDLLHSVVASYSVDLTLAWKFRT